MFPHLPPSSDNFGGEVVKPIASSGGVTLGKRANGELVLTGSTRKPAMPKPSTGCAAGFDLNERLNTGDGEKAWVLGADCEKQVLVQWSSSFTQASAFELPTALKVADLHSLESGVAVTYEEIAAEALAAREPGSVEVVTCMEMLEHVPDPASIVQACATLVKPGGYVFFSTINRNLKAYLLAIVGAEYVLKLLPKGTHDYAKFIKPHELATFCREVGLDVRNLIGLTYNPLTKIYALERDTDVNYMMHAVRSEQ